MRNQASWINPTDHAIPASSLFRQAPRHEAWLWLVRRVNCKASCCGTSTWKEDPFQRSRHDVQATCIPSVDWLHDRRKLTHSARRQNPRHNPSDQVGRAMLPRGQSAGYNNKVLGLRRVLALNAADASASPWQAESKLWLPGRRSDMSKQEHARGWP